MGIISKLPKLKLKTPIISDNSAPTSTVGVGVEKMFPSTSIWILSGLKSDLENKKQKASVSYSSVKLGTRKRGILSGSMATYSSRLSVPRSDRPVAS